MQQLRPQQQQPQRQRRGINENYARELMELHTLGVDGGYTQKDVQEVARCFTGWTIFQPRGGAAAVNAMMGEAGRRNAGTFFFNARVHDDGEKTVLGHKIPVRRWHQRRSDGARHPRPSSIDREVHRDQARAPLCFRHATASSGRSSGGDFHRKATAIFARLSKRSSSRRNSIRLKLIA